jgi:hypothetical protein
MLGGAVHDDVTANPLNRFERVLIHTRAIGPHAFPFNPMLAAVLRPAGYLFSLLKVAWIPLHLQLILNSLLEVVRCALLRGILLSIAAFPLYTFRI